MTHQTSFERADCTVRALANSTGVEYRAAYEAMADAGRISSRGAHMTQVIRAGRALGFDVSELKRKDWRGARTWQSAKKAFNSGSYMVRKTSGRSGHVAGMVNGDIIDWGHRRKFRLTNVFKVSRLWDGRGSQRDFFINTREAA